MRQDVGRDRQGTREGAGAGSGRSPVVDELAADTARLVRALDEVVATEIACWLRYQRHAVAAACLGSGDVAAGFAGYAMQELDHAVLAAERIGQLGGDPGISTNKLHVDGKTGRASFEGTDLAAMLSENLLA